MVEGEKTLPLNDRAITAGRNAEAGIRLVLAEHTDLLGKEVIETIAQRAKIDAIINYQLGRMSGQENDDSNKEPGIVIYLKKEVMERVVQRIRENEHPFSDEQIGTNGEGIATLTFPHGGYSAGMGGLQFYQSADIQEGRIVREDYPFALNYHEVIRIEGNSGELWQNRHYNWDGTPKEK